MDLALPRGGMDRLFRQYDRVVSHRMHDHMQDHEAAPANDAPPWLPETSGNEPDEPDVPKEVRDEAPPELPNGASGGFGKLVGGALALRGIQSQTSVNALRAAPEFEALAEPLLGEAALPVAEGAAMGIADLIPEIAVGALGVAAFDKLERSEYRNSPVLPGEVTFEVDGKTVPAKTFHQAPIQADAQKEVSFKGDENGLNLAYANPQGTYYDPATRTEYVKGSTTATDWWDDVSKIPFGDTARSERYGQAMDAYKDLTTSGKPVERIVGHSLGGAVALEMQKNLAKKGHNVDTRTFGAPVLDPRFYEKSERYRHPMDPVSIFDRGATWGKFKPYSHSYTDYEDFDK